jgi:hypothetical protein
MRGGGDLEGNVPVAAPVALFTPPSAVSVPFPTAPVAASVPLFRALLEAPVLGVSMILMTQK